MKPRTEELLYFLLWTADTLMRPTWRNLNDSFESWAWRNHLGRRLAELERDKLIDRRPDPRLRRVVKLTEQGCRAAWGGRDPVAEWNRDWDGRWRLILFDLPLDREHLRMRLWRALRARHFGCLQGSVWVSPQGPRDLAASLCGLDVEADHFLVIEGRPAAGEPDSAIVDGAWDFESLNRRYRQYLCVTEKPPPTDARLVAWARQELAAWRSAIRLDPLLPRVLLPAGYVGTAAFERRHELLAKLGRFVPSVRQTDPA